MVKSTKFSSYTVPYKLQQLHTFQRTGLRSSISWLMSSSQLCVFTTVFILKATRYILHQSLTRASDARWWHFGWCLPITLLVSSSKLSQDMAKISRYSPRWRHNYINNSIGIFCTQLHVTLCTVGNVQRHIVLSRKYTKQPAPKNEDTHCHKLACTDMFVLDDDRKYLPYSMNQSSVIRLPLLTMVTLGSPRFILL